MPLIRKRRSDVAAATTNDSSPEATPERPLQRRRREEPSSSDESSGADDGDDNDNGASLFAPTSTDVMVKKLIRLALSSEYSRQPIRRTDISAKVLGDQGSRPFKTVFEMAQKALRERFGMELVELPQREKVTASQRRAAQRAEKPSANTNKQWIVQSTLPAEYRCPKILTPAKVQSSATESEYTAIYTLVISVIMLNGGSLPEERLERYLRRVNADNYTPIDSTARTLERMCREKYIVRNRETDGGEELVEYSVGPRGKMEVGPIGVAGLVREVYGRHQSGGEENGDEERNRDFEDRLRRSLGFRTRGVTGGEENGGGSFNHAES